MSIIVLLVLVNLVSLISIQDILGRSFKEINISPAIALMAFFGFTQVLHYPLLILDFPFKFINVVQMLIYFFLILYFLVFNKRSISRFLNSYSLKQWIVIGIGMIFLIIAYRFIRFQLRTDDLNVYVQYMDQRVYSTQSSWLGKQYDYQAFYSWLSSSWYIYQRFAFLSIYEEILPLGFMAWYPSLILFYFLNLVLADVYQFVKSIYNTKWLPFLQSLNIIYTFSLFWYLGFPSYGNQFRRLAIVVIILLLAEEVTKQRKSFAWLTSIMLFALISFSATGLFLSAMLIYGLLFIFPYLKTERYIRKMLIISPPFVIYAILFRFELGIAISIIYGLIFIMALFSLDKNLEELWNKFYRNVFISIPILMILSGYFFPSLVGYTEFENFFSNPDIEMLVDYLSFDVFNFESLSLVLVNGIIWLGTGLFVFKSHKDTSKLRIIKYLLIVIFVSFFNPYVMKFVVTNITSLAYFRIYDFIVNPLTLIIILVIVTQQKQRIQTVVLTLTVGVIILSGVRYSRIWTYVDTQSNLNSLYHVSNEELHAINSISNYISDEVKVDGVNVVAQIHGHHLLTNMDIHFINTFRVDMEENFYEKTDTMSKINQLFLIKDEFNGSMIMDYSQTCKVTKEANIDFVIIESKYNWDIEYELGFCAEWLYTEGTYRVYQMRYDWLD